VTGSPFDPSLAFEDEQEDVTRISIAPPTGRGGRDPSKAHVRDRAALTVVAGSTLGSIYVLGETSLLGRAGDCLVSIDEAVVSRHHARILRQKDGTYVVEDLQSRNGTYVNGERIEQAKLGEGDRLSFGATLTLRFGMTDEIEEALLRRLYESSVTDALTGAYNRKHLIERLAGEVAYAKRHGAALSILMLDIDHFKHVNDTYGHLAGDQVLRELAHRVRHALRAEDMLCRYGGEEFVIVARGLDAPHALLFAERIRALVAAKPIEGDGHLIELTVSIGVASVACLGGSPAVEGLIAAADKRLYAAKDRGRNRCVGA
jgi:two-component system, cell cycle response regulator